MDLNTIWFILYFVLLAGYAVLDGFDLGVGVLHPFNRGDSERRVGLNAIGPVWDGNEVWLLTAGGALFAAFPFVYATVFSAYYLALMLVLTALIARAVSMEFRSKVESPGWRKFWDAAFFAGSTLAGLLFGVAVGNILRGLPLEPVGGQIRFTGDFFGLLNPYSLLVGILSLVMFTLHGSIYLAMKSDGAMQSRVRSYIGGLWIAFIVLYCAATAATILVSPFLFQGVLKNPLFWILTAVLVLAAGTIPLASHAGRFGRAFFASSAMIVSMIGLAALSLFPRLVPSRTDLAHSLSIYNGSSTKYTLTVMLVIALIGMPLVLAYTIFVYRAFKGKTVVTAESY